MKRPLVIPSTLAPAGYREIMSSKIVYYDDIDGSTEDVGTVQFNLDGVAWEIDLSTGNAARLRAALAKYVERARRTPASPRRRGHAATAEPARRDDTHAIREWARENGYQVPARGRISRKIRDAFAAAH